MRVSPATPAEYPVARGIVDAAMLELEPGACRRGSTLLAREEGRVLGALVLDGREIVAIAVRPNRRDQGIGTALVCEATRRRPALEAAFDADVRPFYESLGFAVESDDDRRLRGRRSGSIR